jgi:hypothetical protein
MIGAVDAVRPYFPNASPPRGFGLRVTPVCGPPGVTVTITKLRRLVEMNSTRLTNAMRSHAALFSVANSHHDCTASYHVGDWYSRDDCSRRWREQ